MTLEIRNVTHEDITGIVSLGEAFFHAADMGRLAPWCADSLVNSLAGMIETPAAILIGAFDGEPVGVAGAMTFPAYWNASVTIGQETFWWVNPEHRGAVGGKLLEAMEDAAKELGASVFSMVALEAIKPHVVGRLYQRKGFLPLEHSYWKAI